MYFAKELLNWCLGKWIETGVKTEFTKDFEWIIRKLGGTWWILAKSVVKVVILWFQ